MTQLPPCRLRIDIPPLSVSEATILLPIAVPLKMAVYLAVLRFLDPKVYQGIERHVGIVLGGLPLFSQ